MFTAFVLTCADGSQLMVPSAALSETLDARNGIRRVEAIDTPFPQFLYRDSKNSEWQDWKYLPETTEGN